MFVLLFLNFWEINFSSLHVFGQRFWSFEHMREEQQQQQQQQN